MRKRGFADTDVEEGVRNEAYKDDLRRTPKPNQVVQNVTEAARAVHGLNQCRLAACARLRAKLRYLNAQARDLAKEAADTHLSTWPWQRGD